jgi:hypothetical protein
LRSIYIEEIKHIHARMQQKHEFSDAGERTRTRRKVILHIVFAQLLFNNISQLKAGNKSPSAAAAALSRVAL